ncbi:MAG: hypothetical protein GY927_15515, partial [bacterium]|nr:hypothetical protein [bacterium]
IDLITTRDNIDGFQIVSTTANDSFYVGRLIAYESLNCTMERVLFAASGDNIAVENFKITYDSASISSAVEGIRYDSAGQNLSVRNGYAEALDTASCSHAFRNTGAGDHVLVSGVREGAGLTNAVAASNVTDYLQIINCQGTISDTTGAISNKDVATGNI